MSEYSLVLVVSEHSPTEGSSHADRHEEARRHRGILAGLDRRPTAYEFSFPLAFTAAARHYLLGHSWDDIARSGGRELLVDHIHLGDRGAAQVSELTANWLSHPPSC